MFTDRTNRTVPAARPKIHRRWSTFPHFPVFRWLATSRTAANSWIPGDYSGVLVILLGGSIAASGTGNCPFPSSTRRDDDDDGDGKAGTRYHARSPSPVRPGCNGIQPAVRKSSGMP
ncbi:hypothetical protein Q5P01_010742 [Channa striata]|uniref:Uncharacterized protein n=1 Tax=Channa striata TaxID=64152 RepID=A0AA88MVN6_CHASR|nr:hypothetical protein Q5P01_010742 [Channa striata]